VRGFELIDEGLGARIDPNEPAIVRAYLPGRDRTAARLAVRQARTALGHLQAFNLRPIGELEVSVVHEADWAQAWKAHFPEFWPKGNRFAGALSGISPGDVALLDLAMGGVKLSTGVFVLYADEESFTLMTPEGHMFAGWISFSAEDAGAGTVVQAQVLMRANDPLYELGLTFGGHHKEDLFWAQTLRAVAARFGVDDPVIETKSVCVDRRRQWGHARNTWHNAMIRSMLQTITHPFGRAGRPGEGGTSAPHE